MCVFFKLFLFIIYLSKTTVTNAEIVDQWWSAGPLEAPAPAVLLVLAEKKQPLFGALSWMQCCKAVDRARSSSSIQSCIKQLRFQIVFEFTRY